MVEHLHALADVPAEAVPGRRVLDGAEREVGQLAEPGRADDDDEEEDAAEGDEQPATRHSAEYSLGMIGSYRLGDRLGAGGWRHNTRGGRGRLAAEAVGR